jgi:dihydropteroate synthase
VKPGNIILDPGLGFAKTGAHNWELLRSLDRLGSLGHRVLVAASRKRFLGTLLTSAGRPAVPAERDAATLAVSALAAANGAWAVRVHDVGPTLDAVKVASAWAGQGPR